MEGLKKINIQGTKATEAAASLCSWLCPSFLSSLIRCSAVKGVATTGRLGESIVVRTMIPLFEQRLHLVYPCVDLHTKTTIQ